MPEKTDALLEQLNKRISLRHRLRQALLYLSLLVIPIVFWSLKLTGIGVAGEAFCGMDEHVHTEECQKQTLICTLEETPGHVHTDDCRVKELCCQPEEGAEHTHTEECYRLTEEFGCGLEESEGHTHKETCYLIERSCPLKEHIHVASCYSNIEADLETREDWEKGLTDLSNGPTTAQNMVLVARSQLGNGESELNFQVDEFGVRRGITRYGQWYGNPYGDWSAMFVAFCLNYAGAEDVPTNAGPESMRIYWETDGLYKPLGEATPQPGDLLFLCKTEDTESATSVAIITAIDETGFDVIEGDLDGQVAETRYELADGQILGFGLVPSEDALIVLDRPGLPEGGFVGSIEASDKLSSDSENPIDPLAANQTIWLDGTGGGQGHLKGSPNTAYTVENGSVLKLPTEWTSPSKYSYKLRGWYDVTNSRYYAPGAEMTVTGNAVLYADWVASTYDIGVFNEKVAETVSTNSFITTHLFDYNYLFNVHSAKATVTVNNREHKETWSMVTSGTVPFGDAATLNFIFIDNDTGGLLCMPNNRSDQNVYPGSGIVTSNIYSDKLGQWLFSPYNCFDPATGTGVIGKDYLGTGDHLFQIMEDPNDEHYGYYYYDSQLNAASYSQSRQRFYIYDYLEATSDAIGSTNSDFLPLNSPYANSNGKTVGSYNYAGVNGEYQGVPHYRYDSKYDSGNYNSVNNVHTNYAYGMRSDILFYLPNEPGSGGNKDLLGNDMVFEFTGDDDLWVLIDGQLVLDIGGIHGAEAGVIDFSTGIVTVQGKQTTTLMSQGIGAGDHTLSVLYLERGSSLSNCSIYFNLAPRFGLQLQKEDVLTQELLDGAEFSVYEDLACTTPAELWESEQAYNEDLADGALDQFRNTFTVKNGVARLWGLGSGNTYYIKETNPPDKAGYGPASGIIRLTIEKAGHATYHVDVIPEADGTEPSNGFTVHGVRIDEETQTVYITVTNAPETVVETTTVQVIKKWADNKSHSTDYIEAYLTVTDSDGTRRRIRAITLSDENNWTYTWTNLPKYDYDNLGEVQYGIEESYESGYYSTVRRITQIEITTTEWAEAASFINGESYILKSSSGYLSTTSNSDAKLKWVDEATAQESPLATWTVTVSGGKVKFVNGANQILTFVYNSNSSRRYYYATTATSGTNIVQTFTPEDAGTGFRFFARRNNSSSGTKYYISNQNINNSGQITTTTGTSGALILTPMERITETDIQEVGDWAYEITNTPLAQNNETSLSVQKQWVIPDGYDSHLYQEFTVTVRLLANGVNTGRTITLSLKNNWSGIFQGLPYKDDNGNVIYYSAEEIWEQPKWKTSYGAVQSSGTSPPSYSVTITNTYHPGGPELPATGTAARLLFVLSGSGLMLASLVCGIVLRRKRERRKE